VLGAVRVAAVLVLIVVGTVVLLAAALLPVRVGGARPAQHVAAAVCRAFLWATGTRLVVEGRGALRAHRGFVFFNHLSFLDPVVLVAARPLRFLSTQGVRSIPFVGWMATALGTIYVHRGREASRDAARQKLRAAVARSRTPVALAPEGEIGPGPGVLPFRRGAFEVAADADAPVLLVALRFEPHAYALWRDGEWLVGPLWRLCARRRPFTATVTALPPALPVDADPAGAAAEAERRLDAVLVRAPSA
jgi:1-acyl-sn-glycerol-3-phosphate acyltransferase